MLDATDVILQVDAKERDCRVDGQLRADAKVGYRGVILSFQTESYGSLTYSCDRFTRWNRTEAWHANLRAVALGLESLRRVERYGIAERGQQYAGYAALGMGVALGRNAPLPTLAQSAAFLSEQAADGSDGGDLMYDVDEPCLDSVNRAYRAAVKRLHPDTGTHPDADLFDKATKAADHLRGSAR